MYQVAICDDEKIFLTHIKFLAEDILHSMGVESHIECFTNPLALLEEVERNPTQYHLLLLDILMAEASGMELAKQIRARNQDVGILFITSAAEFSLESYAVYPTDYLLKPVDREKLRIALEREYSKHFLAHRILLRSKCGDVVLLLDDVRYIESLNRTIVLHLDSGDVESKCTLNALLKQLPEQQFIQCHKSYVVNLKWVMELSRNGAVLRGGTQVPVGRAYYPATLHTLASYLGR